MQSQEQVVRPVPRASAGILCILGGALIVSAAMGVRQTFGLFVAPLSFEQGLPITEIAFAMALHNLIWGFAQPFAGAAADRFGAAPVIAFGAAAFSLGMLLAAVFPNPTMLIFSMGVLVGVGISCTSFGVVLPAVGRGIPEHKRSMAMGLVTAGGSFGQVLLVPLTQGIAGSSGTATALIVLAACILAAAPLGLLVERKGTPEPGRTPIPRLSIRAAISQAGSHQGYRLLTIGFFVCGFQLAFIGIHLPAYLTLCQMPEGLGAIALALIGLFNMIGSWACGWMGGRFPQQHILGWLYLVRGAAIAAFFLLPVSEASVIIFASVMGLIWLGTVPLTSGLIAKVFGTGHLGTLFGICFLSHQIGSFLGAWLGGYLFDLTGSYSIIWITTAIASLVAAALHFPIKASPALGPVAARA